MGLFSKLFGNKSAAKSLPADSGCFPLFYFDCKVLSEARITSYGQYARLEIARRLATAAPELIADPNSRGYFGDLIYPEELAKLLANEKLEVDLSLLPRVASQHLTTGVLADPGYFVVGTGNTFNSVVEVIHASLSASAVAGYVGVSRFIPLGQEDSATVAHALSLVTDRWPRV